MVEHFESIKKGEPINAAAQNAADIWSGKNRAAFTGLSRAAGGTFDGIKHLTGVEIVPCTPPGMDPLKDPANPKSPQYDAKTFGPKPPEPVPLIPKDGVVTPEDLMLRKQVGPIYAPQFGPYDGACKVYPDKPEEDHSKDLTS